MTSTTRYAPRRANVRSRLNHYANWTALGSALAVFSSGLVLLICFHIGPGSQRTEALGLGRLAWINLHRLAALPLIGAVGTHAWLHWRLLKRRAVDLLLYGGFAVACLTALAAWFVIEGSSPLDGPLRLTHAYETRHHWIDVHNLAALVTLVPAWLHIRRHWPWFERALPW